MTRVMTLSAAIMLGAAACSTAPTEPKPAVWSANYALPYDFMANCLAARPPMSYAASPPAFTGDGVAIVSIAPVNAPPINAHNVVRRMPGNTSQVSWRRPDHVGGLDWLDNETRMKANGCAA